MSKFFNSPTVHFYRNVFSHVPHTKVADVAAMLKAIHAQEDRQAALQKAELVVAKMKAMKLPAAARTVAEGIGETLTYAELPREHWRKIRTNNPMERVMREIRRRTRVVGNFPTATLPSCLSQHACATLPVGNGEPASI